MIRKAWNTILRISLLLMVAATFGTAAWADGTHGSTFTVKNQSGGKILVYTYNGNDSVCEVAHKQYVIDSGGERTAKCHGKGTGRCKFLVFAGSTIANIVITEATTCLYSNLTEKFVDKIEKGAICTITGRYSGDYWCGLEYSP